MTHGMTGERILMRIFIGESDKCTREPYRGKPLYEALLVMFREKGFAGATVVRAIAGFGASAKMHTDRLLRLSLDLPIIVEVVEREERIEAVLPTLEAMIGGGLVTLERVRVIVYRASDDETPDRRE